ncbi:DUF2277 domain-containing protein [Candidatus Cerribacteria bacterium 'Amazon FNV 2010 28 9']|uniref:DUF2277 domain-containing protein n=1 Tax=Candidatus Cerribacteria bacterium 'Amazon FNV 2010 28 9' TaxID=2081795 RepID=A0A317JPJ0_9BACT|nr:MAG: DUF2277 domain-containing protein [Candidatus Cerribacteria bacterium 'Amazon FNV 2010 28 9']
MCRNIKTLFNFVPPATNEEIHAASLQFVRKISGFNKPSNINEKVFNQAVKEVSLATGKLMDSLITNAAPHDREVEAQRAHKRAKQRFSNK